MNEMFVRLITVKLYAPWVHTLKEKRAVVKSLCEKLRRRFNASVAESGRQDTHQTAVITVAYLAGDAAAADKTQEAIVRFIENSTDAQIAGISTEER